MSVLFLPNGHKYVSKDPTETIDWLSVTTFVSKFKKPFDKVKQAHSSSKNKRSKWYGMSVDDILDCWDNETYRAASLGTLYHSSQEKEILGKSVVNRHGVDIPVISPILNSDLVKEAPEQKLQDGIYPEHFVYLKSAKICGQADVVEIYGNTINIIDYKTNKEIKTVGYTNWEGITSKMLGPCSHLDDCNYNHYALQLSTYMYIMQKHNPKLKPGRMYIHHVVFDIDGYDDKNNPLVSFDLSGNPVVKEIIPYELPYLKREVMDMINYIKKK